MALELLCFQWWIMALLAFCKISGTRILDDEKLLRDSTFDCTIDFEGTDWSMECESNNFDFESTTMFFTAKLRGLVNSNNSLSLIDVLNSTSFNDSEIFLCDGEWRYFIVSDRSMLYSNCIKKSLLNSLIYILNESSIIKIGISHSKSLHSIMNSIVSKSFQLKNVLITENYITNMSFFPVPLNNSVKILSLKDNSIQVITDGLFSQLNHLETLDLSHNLLKSINKIMFIGVIRVTYLDLAYNIIEYVSQDALSNLVLLEYISLSNNRLKSIEENIFKYSRFLSIIDISDNEFKSLPRTLFHNMQNLKNVSCSNCSLLKIDKDIFQNSSNLVWTVFNQNKVQYLHSDIFKDLNFLEVVALSENNISYLNSSLFSNHPYLMYVNFSDNRISELNLGVFTGARNVRYLDFSLNRITSDLTDDYVKNFTDIEHFGLHHNKITAIKLGIDREVRVRVIDVSYNLIKSLDVRWKQLIMIEKFNLNNNFLTSIDLPPCIPNMKQTLTFSFQYNKISKVKMDALLFDEDRVKTDRTMMCFFNGLARNFVDLTNNPLHCDCSMYPFYKYIRQKSPRRYQIEIFIDKGNITCEKPDYLSNHALVSLSDDMLSCPLNEICPKPCYCGTRGNDNSIFINCSSKALQEVPKTYPEGTTILYFNKNLLTSIVSLNNNSWPNLTELHLDYNLLSNLDNWKFPQSLRYLSVRGNLLKLLPQPLMQFISNQSNFELYFGDNDFNCGCDRKIFKYFLRDNIGFIKDNDDVLCNLTSNSTYDVLPLTSVLDSVLCNQNPGNFKQVELIIFLCAFFTVSLTVLLIYYKKRQLLLSYFYVHCRGIYDMIYDDTIDDDAIFDAFVAYSSSDRDIVLQLLEELENKPPFFQLCIHERNWLPGRFITDNIADSVENSRRTIIILSSTFLSSPWFNIELRAAMCKITEDALNRIIVILTDKTVSLDKIDPELRYVVSKRTYLEWGERWFWEKLRYVLPRKSIKEAKLDNQRGGSISELALIPCKNTDGNISD